MRVCSWLTLVLGASSLACGSVDVGDEGGAGTTGESDATGSEESTTGDESGTGDGTDETGESTDDGGVVDCDPGPSIPSLSLGPAMSTQGSLVGLGLMDGDDWPDVVLQDDAGFEILVGDGAGGFVSAQTLNYASTPSLASNLVDMDADGLDDLLFPTFDPSPVARVLRSDGDGTVSPWGQVSLGVAIGIGVHGLHVDGDDHTDIVALDDGELLYIANGTGGGGFSEPATTLTVPQLGFVAAPMRTGDIDGDGFDDLLVYGDAFYRADGQGGLEDAVMLGEGAYATLAQLDGEPGLEIVRVDEMRQLSIQSHDGDDFGDKQLMLGKHWGLPVIGDFNGDNTLDILVALAFDSPKVSFFLGCGEAHFNGPESGTMPFFPERSASADLDADGDLDIVITGPGGLHSLLNDG